MAKNRTIQIYRGTTAQNDAYTGFAGELTMDTDKKEIRLHDGSTQGGKVIGAGYHPDLFTWQWADHELNDVQWLRADTFSWQSGAVYQAAYQHLVDDITGKTATSETVGGVTISFYLADDGHKITTDESAVADIYTATGVAWYYIIDTTNQRFKLPRDNSKHGRLISKGGNASGWYRVYADGWVEQGGIASGNSGTITLPVEMADTNYVITDSPIGRSGYNYHIWQTSNITTTSFDLTIAGTEFTVTARMWRVCGYCANTPIDQYLNSHKHLYFYVGNFTQTALENTAGLNASLFNAKMDIDAGNVTSSGKKVFANSAMPSSNIQAMTLGASGATYTAPADGYVVFTGMATATGQYVYIGSSTFDNVAFQSSAVGNGEYIIFTIPVSKGQVFTVNYNLGGAKSLRFIYANGAQ